ncbi:MAG TPA: hypothetical protein VFR17_08490 [Mycobacterium sp.]|nr:hypothetical protein [Mycobacterium sp.]
MLWTTFCGIARATLAAALIAAPATVVTAAPAYADCGDPGQPACAGPVPTPDEVAGLLNQLTDPATPDPVRSGLVAGGLSPDELSVLDDHANRYGAYGSLPLGFVVTDIQPAPNNYAGATVSTPKPWPGTAPQPLVLVEQGGHWLLDHDTTMTLLGRVWSSWHRRGNPFLC